MSTARPALERELAFQFVSLEIAFWARFPKTSRDGRPLKLAHPRYLPKDELVGIFKIPLTCYLSSEGVFLENTIRDLCKLINCPD